MLNTPHNPTGKAFGPEELAAIAEIAVERDLLVFTDEIYEHVVYDGLRHLPMALAPGMRERTVTISALSKTYSVTGWRVGWAVSSPRLVAAIRKVHDFLTVGGPGPRSRRRAPSLLASPIPITRTSRGHTRSAGTSSWAAWRARR